MLMRVDQVDQRAEADRPPDNDSSEVNEMTIMNQTRDAPSADSAQVQTAKAFLLTLTRTKSATRRSPYSYMLKHNAENWGRANGMEPYVTNDAVIAAAFELDLLVLWEGGRSPNALIGVTRASENRARERLDARYVDPRYRGSSLPRLGRRCLRFSPGSLPSTRLNAQVLEPRCWHLAYRTAPSHQRAVSYR